MIRNLLVLGALATTFPGMTLSANQAARALPIDDDDSEYVGESPERYVQVRVVEGSAVVHKGELTEDLTRGIPLTEGDVVEARGRGVLQLSDGSRIVFGEGAKFTLASLFADRDRTRQVVLQLDRGHIRVQVGTLSQAVFKVETPAGRGLFQDRANVSFSIDGNEALRVSVFRGRALVANEEDRTTLAAGETLTAYGRGDRLNRIREFNTYELDGFDRWADRHLQQARGVSYDRLPEDLRAYGDDLDREGDWIEVEDIGWCWRPRGIEAEWRPYWRGRWGAYATGMTWVSDEPWGYVTYHHGRWGWHARHGWYWVPGSLYAPAWVAWRVVDSMFGWSPLDYWNRPCGWGYHHWNGGFAWNVVSINHIHHHGVYRHLHNDRRVIHSFNAGYGSTSGQRITPWRRTPVLVRPSEWRDGQALRAQAFREDNQRERLAQMVRERPDRLIFQRPTPATRELRDRGDTTAQRLPFLRREPTSDAGRSPIFRREAAFPERDAQERRDIRPPRQEDRITIPNRLPSRDQDGFRPRPEDARRTWDGRRTEGLIREERRGEPRREGSSSPRSDMRRESPPPPRSEPPRRESRSESRTPSFRFESSRGPSQSAPPSRSTPPSRGDSGPSRGRR